MIRVTHLPTGETALCKRVTDDVVLLQFDRFDHPESHGWHTYPAADTAPVPQPREEATLYPGPEVGGPMHNTLRRGGLS